MSTKENLLAEFQREAAVTRKMLERIPADKLTWKPHEKSMSLGKLASHVSQTPVWLTNTVTMPEYDFAKSEYKEVDFDSPEKIVENFDKMVNEAHNNLNKSSDESLAENWKLKAGDTVYMELPRASAARYMCYSHLIHHRGQLSVYLRMLDVPLPSVYGPTADEQM